MIHCGIHKGRSPCAGSGEGLAPHRKQRLQLIQTTSQRTELGQTQPTGPAKAGLYTEPSENNPPSWWLTHFVRIKTRHCWIVKLFRYELFTSHGNVILSWTTPDVVFSRSVGWRSA